MRAKRTGGGITVPIFCRTNDLDPPRCAPCAIVGPCTHKCGSDLVTVPISWFVKTDTLFCRYNEIKDYAALQTQSDVAVLPAHFYWSRSTFFEDIQIGMRCGAGVVTVGMREKTGLIFGLILNGMMNTAGVECSFKVRPNWSIFDGEQTHK